MSSNVKIPTLIKDAIHRRRSEEAEMRSHYSQPTMTPRSGTGKLHTNTKFQNFYSSLEQMFEEDT